jgi:hypothetical protein
MAPTPLQLRPAPTPSSNKHIHRHSSPHTFSCKVNPPHTYPPPPHPPSRQHTSPHTHPHRTKRLDFSYFEFNLPSFEAVLEGCWAFHTDFKAQQGFAPRGYAIYFVNRGYTPDTPTPKTSASKAAAAAAAEGGKGDAAAAGGVLAKPYGNYSQWGPGTSFMMDPITDDADSPLVSVTCQCSQFFSCGEAWCTFCVSIVVRGGRGRGEASSGRGAVVGWGGGEDWAGAVVGAKWGWVVCQLS